MKNLLNYYYNLNVKEFRKIGESFVFEINNTRYCFLPIHREINEFYKIYSLISRNNIYCHQIISNKDNSIITFNKNNPYILLKKNMCSSSLINFNDILNYSVNIYGDYRLNWKNLWKNKIDYYEYQISQIGSEYKILKESFSYYTGISEIAINLLNYVNDKNIKPSICHNRINYKEDIDEFLNPLNIIVDSKIRDISEYIKINYIFGEYDLNYILHSVLPFINMNDDEATLLLARLLYPSYYFDLYDKIIQKKISEDKIDYYIKKNVQYETFLKGIYKYLKKTYKIPEIEWFEF